MMKKIYKHPLVEIHRIDAVHVIASSTMGMSDTGTSDLPVDGSGDVYGDVRGESDWDIW